MDRLVILCKYFSFFFFISLKEFGAFYRHAVVLEFGFKDFHCRVLVEVMNAESETVE